MSDKALPDELRSVLLSHSFDAPAPADTIARTLAQTVEADREEGARGPGGRSWWRPALGALVAAAVVGVLAVGGTELVVAARRGPATGSSAAAVPASGQAGSDSRPDLAPAQGIGPDLVIPSSGAPLRVVPNNLSCATGPGAKAVTTLAAAVQLGGGTDEVLAAQCTDATGLRATAQVYTVDEAAGTAAIRATVLRQSDGISVVSLTGGVNQFTVRYLRLATANTAESLEQRTFRTTDGGLSYASPAASIIAPACSSSGLAARLEKGPIEGSSLLSVTNRGPAPCELNGYPTTPGVTRTLGRIDGNGLVPMVVLRPGQAARAEFGPPSRTPCPTRLGPPEITLPTGEQLHAVEVQVAFGCPGTVQPFRGGS